MADRHGVVVVGGGPVGAVFALLLSQFMRGERGDDVLLLEAREHFPAQGDPRALALSYGSRLILERLGVWERLSARTAIDIIHVSQRGSLGRTVLDAREQGVPSLGYVVDYDELDAALRAKLSESTVTCLTGARAEHIESGPADGWVRYVHAGQSHTAHASLIALADGGRGATALPGIQRKTRDYGQTAVVGRVRVERTAPATAYERFTPHGPVALLPDRDGYALIWTTSPGQADELAKLDDGAFLRALYHHFGDRLGRFTTVRGRGSFPLRLQIADPTVSGRVVLVGNAAQTLHPVAGQGFNLGLRDAWELAEQVRVATPSGDVGSPEALARYRARRRWDVRGGVAFTDGLIRVFSHPDPVLAHLRATGLTVLDLAPPLRRFIGRRMMFGARGG